MPGRLISGGLIDQEKSNSDTMPETSGKLISGGLINKSNSEDQQSNADESWLGSLLRNVTRGAERIAEAPAVLTDISSSLQKSAINKLAPKQNISPEKREELDVALRKGQPTSEEFRETIGSELPKDYLKPRNKGEEVLDLVAGDLPFILGAGTSPLWAKLARSAASNIGIKSAESAGAGKLGQFLGGAAGGIGFDAIRKGAFPGNIRKIVKSTMKKDYSKAEKLASPLVENAQNLENSLRDELTTLSSGASKLPSELEKEVKKQFLKADKDIFQGKINISKAIDRKQHFNSLFKEETNKQAREYYRRAVGSLNKTIQSAAEKNPEFGAYWNRAEDLYKSVNAPTVVRQILEEYTDLKKILKNPVSQILTTGISWQLGGLRGAAIKTGTALGLRTMARAAEMYSRSPNARKILKDIAKESFDDNRHALALSFKKLNKEADEFENGGV